MDEKKILNKYSKEIIIEWVTNKYPVFLNKKLREELEYTKKEVEYEKMQKELDSLLKEQEELMKKKQDYNVLHKRRNNRQRIGYLLKEIDRYIDLLRNSEVKE